MTTAIVKRVLFCACVAVPILAFVAGPLLGQRNWRQGDMWLKWSLDARNSYVLGYFEGSAADHSQSREQNSEGQFLGLDTADTARSITEFYARYPEDRDIYIREVIEQLQKGLTLEQMHNYSFWRHEPPKVEP